MAARLILSKRQLQQLRTTAAPTPPAPARKPRPKAAPLFGPGLPVVLSPEGCLLRIRLPIRLTNNNHGRGHSYHASDKFRKECELQLRAWGLDRHPLPFAFEVAVRVHVIRVLGPRQKLFDTSSVLRGNWKEIEDSLVAIGWFHGDQPKWIAGTTSDQVADDRGNGPSIIVEIRAVSN